MFLVDILPVVKSLPPKIEEGYFEFFYRKQINDIKIPPTDHQLVWPFLIKESRDFGVFVLILKKNLLRLRLKQNLFKEIILN